ncbi:hypothetical protein [Zymobacter sp. IVIA_12111.31 C1]|uniref:hypothetical protein n=1 Tax=Zymobacter sp. IVIA_12111.31 C1 TaxID=3394854 RepID=UPI0039C0DCEA
MVGAYDVETGQIAIGSSNGKITAKMLHPKTVEYVESKLNVKIGEFTSLCPNKAGACAEISAADRLIREGADPSKIKFTDAVRPRAIWRKESLEKGMIIKPCENFKVTWPKEH